MGAVGGVQDIGLGFASGSASREPSVSLISMDSVSLLAPRSGWRWRPVKSLLLEIVLVLSPLGSRCQ
jgi:hypothetical protein